MRPTRNWTTYVPETESALRKKCIELSPTFQLSTNATSKSTSGVANRCNQNNNYQFKDCEPRNGIKNHLRKSNDSVNQTATTTTNVAQFGGSDDSNDAGLSSKTTATETATTTAITTAAAAATATIPNEVALKSGLDKNFEDSTKPNSIDIDADCDKSNTNLDRAPLIQLSPNKSITLVKQNSTSLIFTKKDVNPVVHRKRITLVRSTGSHSNSEITTTTATAALTSSDGNPIISHTDESVLSPKKRHSFHWHSDRNNGISSADKTKRKQIKSWYAVIGSPSVRESTFDSDSEESVESSHAIRNEFNGNRTTLEQWMNQKSVESSKTLPISYRPTNFNNAQEMGHHANSAYGIASGSKYNRFEQLLKNLVGRKVSRESPTITPSLSTSAIIGNSATIVNTVAQTQSNGSNGTRTSYSSNDTFASQKYAGDDTSCASRSDDFMIENHQLNQPLLVSSPEIKISRTPSAHNLFRNDKCLMSTSSASTTSLNATVHQRLWSVVPLLRREGSCASLNSSAKPLLHQRSDVGLKKCETVSALTHSQTTSNFEPIKPRNRLRQSPTMATCSRCSSILSLAANGSRYSLNIANGGFVPIPSNLEKSSSIHSDVNKADQASLIRSSLASLSTSSSTTIACKLCLSDVRMDKITKIQQCGCQFCIDCMKAYVEFEILEGAYDISCPDALCPHQGIMDIELDIAALASSELIDKHKRFRLNREIEVDKNRTWCPRAGCETVCLVEPKPKDKNGIAGQSGSLMSLAPVAVKCPTCVEEFCSSCKKAWHPMMTCEENSRRLAANGTDDSIGIPFDTDLIKCCPMCGVPIEKDEGCAQMMCKRCKHVFCWYCLASLDDDFLLRHYDKGPCKNKLGHSRASVVWHRAQVIGIFASFGILLLVASPLLLLAAPCIVCCKCRACSTKLDDVDNDFDDPNNGTQNR